MSPWVNGRSLDPDDWDDAAPLGVGVERLTEREIRDEGGRWRRDRLQAKMLTDAQRAALRAALDADDDIPSGLYRHRRSTGPELGPAHLSNDRVRRRPLDPPGQLSGELRTDERP